MLMTSEEKREITKRMRNGTYRGDHYGDYWTPEEDEKLRISFTKAMITVKLLSNLVGVISLYLTAV